MIRPGSLTSLAFLLAACAGNLVEPDAGDRGALADRPGALEGSAGSEARPADRSSREAPRVADAGDPCKGVTCSGHGQCKVVSGKAACECAVYYKPGPGSLTCIDACSGISCAPGKTCIPGHHNTTDPMCVDTCDCSNCGNCILSQIPAMGVLYCGSGSAPATVTCTKPCAPGSGCIPYAVPICWPGQGCLSK